MTDTSTNDLTSLVKQGCFVQVHFSRPTLRTQLTWKDLGHAQLDGVVSAPSTRPPSETYNEFSKLESRARVMLTTHTTGRRGLRFMHFAKYQPFMELVQPVVDAYLAHVPEFLSTWEDSVREALNAWKERAAIVYNELSAAHRAELGTQEDFTRRLVSRLRRSWPDAETLESRFAAEVEVQQFAFDGGGGAEAMAAAMDPQAVRDMKRRTEETLQRFLTDSKIELRQRAVDTVRRMHGVLVKGDTVTERSVKPLRAFVDQFRELQVVPDTEFQATLEGLVQTIDHHGGAEGMRDSTDAWLEVQGLLDEVAQEGERLVDEAVRQKTGPGNRKIRL